MGAAIFAICVVLAGVGSLVGLVHRIERTEEPDEHYALAIRFWRRVGLVGGLVAAILAYALLSSPIGFGSVAAATFLLMSLPPVAVLAAGWRNSRALRRHAERRRRALAEGKPVPAEVVALRPMSFAQDLVVVEVDLELPADRSETGQGYRARPLPPRRVRTRQVAPSELACRLAVGARVTATVVPDEPDVFTLWPAHGALPEGSSPGALPPAAGRATTS